MQNKRYRHTLLSNIRKTGLFFLLLAAAFLLQETESSNTAFASSKGKETGNFGKDTEDAITFQNDSVEAGVPLKVLNAPKASTFQWKIISADGSKKTFTTQENTYTPSKDDMEKLIIVTVKGTEQETASIYYSTLPVVYINNTYGYYGVKEDYSDAVMSMQGNETFPDQDQLYSGNIDIKLRGNSTKYRDKRPFNIKLEDKTNLLGMGKNKHWALLANDIDHTLMRNKLLYEFSGAIGMQTYCKSENVVLIFNNEYCGVYQLCELVDLGSDRVNIYDWEDTAEKAAEAIVEKASAHGKFKEDKNEENKTVENKTEENKIEENNTQEDKINEDKTEELEKKLEDALCEDLSWITDPYTFSYDLNNDGKKESYTITDYVKLPKATGGALLEMDFFSFEGTNPSTMISSYSMPWYFKSPEYAATNSTFFQYIRNYVQSFEYALHSTDFIYHDKDAKYIALNRQGGNQNSGYAISDFTAPEYDGKHYSELFDLNSLVQNFLVCEYSMNWDSMKNSVFLYKDMDGLFYIGPEWDFDWAWGNINMFDTNTWYPTSWQTTENAFTKEQYYQTVQWNRCLIRDPYFLVRVYEKYKQIRPTIIEDMIKDGGTIDTYAKQLKTAAIANDAKWEYTYSKYNSVGFDESVKNMKKFITTRLNWMDQQFETLDTLIDSLGYYKPDKELKVTQVDTKSEKGEAVVTVQANDADIASVVLQVNGTARYEAKVSSGQAVCRISKKDLLSKKDILNVIQVLAVDAQGKYIIASEDKGNYTQAKSNYAVFYNNQRSDNALDNVGASNNPAQEVLAVINHNSGSTRIFRIAVAVGVLLLFGLGIWIALKYHKKRN